jgi:hypothetical protein
MLDTVLIINKRYQKKMPNIIKKTKNTSTNEKTKSGTVIVEVDMLYRVRQLI